MLPGDGTKAKILSHLPTTGVLPVLSEMRGMMEGWLFDFDAWATMDQHIKHVKIREGKKLLYETVWNRTIDIEHVCCGNFCQNYHSKLDTENSMNTISHHPKVFRGLCLPSTGEIQKLLHFRFNISVIARFTTHRLVWNVNWGLFHKASLPNKPDLCQLVGLISCSFGSIKLAQRSSNSVTMAI